MSKARILFVINGTGLGNSTRCHAIISALKNSDLEIDVATSGNGLGYFRDRAEISRLFPLRGSGYRGKRSIGVGALARSLSGFIAAGAVNSARLFRVLRERRPSLVVYDSSFNLVPIFYPGVRVVSLNNSDRIVREFFRLRNKPWSIYPQFFLVECLDFLFQKIFPARVISPWFAPGSREPVGKFYPVGPIVRADVRSKPPEIERRRKRVVLLYSGSDLGEEISREIETCPVDLEVIGRNGPSGNAVRYLGRVRDNPSLIADADLLFTNGGFSSLSEGLALGKPLLVLPIEGHAEQYINARKLNELGLALPVSRETARSALDLALKDPEFFLRAESGASARASGASEAARLLRTWL